MVTKSKKENVGKKKKIKVLNLKKETVKNLTDDESKRVKGWDYAVLDRCPSPSAWQYFVREVRFSGWTDHLIGRVGQPAKGDTLS